ncbi:MAG: methionyl-tRNA formyltransferase [Spirochaetota bacterium]
MRVLFAGTPQIAVPTLRAIAGSDHELVGVLTAPDRARGRGRSVRISPVKDLALELGVPVLQPESLRGDARREVAALEPDVLACFAYGRIFGPRFLKLFPHGGLNVHPSLLPRHRGPAPIPAAILSGDVETGVTIQELALEMDAGDILAQERIPLTGTETTASLGEAVAPVGGRLLVDVLDALERGDVRAVPQDPSHATYTSLVKKEDGRIDWRESAAKIDRMVRAYTPWPRAFTTWGDERLNILEAVPVEQPAAGGDAVPAAGTPGRVLRVDTENGVLVETGNGLLALRKLQLQSRNPLEWRSFLNGVNGFLGAVLGGS